MKHYIWLSLLLALGVVQAADDKAEENKEEVAAPEKADEAPAEEAATEKADEAPAEEGAAPAAEEKTDESAPKQLKRKGRKSRTRSRRKGHKSHKGHKGGHKAKTPSASVLNAYMNRVQSGEMCSTAPASSMSVTVSDQGACATGKCGLPEAAPAEATTEAVS